MACGGVGLSAVDIASAIGVRVIAVSRSQEKLDLARRLGAEHTVAAGPDAAAALVELTGGSPRVRRHIRAGSVVSRLPRASMDT